MSRTSLLSALTIGCLAVLPFGTALGLDPYYLTLASRLAILALFALSLDLLVGLAGMVSLGHAAFFGLGGYGLAILAIDGSAPPAELAIPLALVGCAAAATVIGWFSTRTREVGFLMITLAFAQMLYFLFNESTALGSSDGLFLSGYDSLFGLSLWDETHFHWIVTACLGGALLVLLRIKESRFGRLLAAGAANPVRVRALGIDLKALHLVAFILAGALAGLAGILDGLQNSFVSPGSLHWKLSGLALVIVLLGRRGTLIGPVLAAFGFGLLQDQLQDTTTHWHLWLGLGVMGMVLVPAWTTRLGRAPVSRLRPFGGARKSS
ncbi:MAG: branched-chain amino acid ABC transporter permease [Magnetovibrionaceae bacterium]